MAQGHAVGIDYSVSAENRVSFSGASGSGAWASRQTYLATNGRNLIGIAASGEAPPAPIVCIYTTKTPPLSVEDWFSSTDKYDLLFGRSA